jgi:hypothetical protein
MVGKAVDIPQHLWLRLFFLRTWVYFYAIVTYLFIGNLWLTIFIVEGLEAIHSFLVWIRLTAIPREMMLMTTTTPSKTALRTFFYGIDVIVAVMMAVVASLSIVFVEYVFNSVVFIGEDRTVFFTVFLFLVFAARCILLFVRDQMFSILTVFAVFFLLFFFAVMGTNEIFFNDARTVTISVVYMVYTIVTVMLWLRWIHYYGYLVHAVGLIIFLAIFWNKHSSIPLARYLNWRHPI